MSSLVWVHELGGLSSENFNQKFLEVGKQDTSLCWDCTCQIIQSFPLGVGIALVLFLSLGEMVEDESV